MEKKRRRTVIYLFLSFILLALQIPLMTYASNLDETDVSSGTLFNNSSIAPTSGLNESSDSGLSLANEVKITGYTIYNKDGSSRVNDIVKGQQVSIHVYMADEREQTFSYEPVAVINTTSFKPIAASSKGDAKYTTGTKNGTYTLIFTCQYTGIGSIFGFDLSYPNSGVEMKYISIGLNQCTEYIEPEATPKAEPTPAPEVTVKGTGFAVKSLNYGSGPIYAGGNFELQIVLLATKGDYALEDVSISLVLPAELSSTDGNMVQYMGTVQPGNEMAASFLLVSDASAEQGSYSITMNVRGMSGEDGAEVTSAVEISIPVKQSERFEFSKVSLPAQLNAAYDDGQGYTTIYFINKGKTPIYNITVSVEGDHITVPDGAIFFGNLESGKEGNVDCNLVATEAGTLSGNIMIKYENAQGISNELKKEFTVEAGMGEAENSANTGPIDVNITEENAVPAWIWVLIGMAVVLLWSGIRHFIRKKRADQIALLEEETPDDDF